MSFKRFIALRLKTYDIHQKSSNSGSLKMVSQLVSSERYLTKDCSASCKMEKLNRTYSTLKHNVAPATAQIN